jgi:chemotaxis protein CheD
LIDAVSHTDLITSYLFPASLEISDTPKLIHTILGSCVAVCLYDKVNKRGGINHYMLPFWNGTGLPTPKYVNIAIDRLLENMLLSGSKKEHLVLKVFGGGEVLTTHNQTYTIGKRNIDVALELIYELRIPVIAESTGGKYGRKIVFNTFSGEVKQRYLKP